MRTFFIMLLTILSVVGKGQTDSVFGIDEFRSSFLKHHPLAYQAKLLQQAGDAQLMMARGGFDPKLDGAIHQKYLEGKEYYSYMGGKLKVPTWFGISLEAGYNLNDGSQLNPEAYTNDLGLWNAGVSISLGRGLLMDQRRADLLQARVIRMSNMLEQKLAINQLRLDAEKAYWNWSKQYSKFLIVQNSLRAAEERFDAVKDYAQLGDKPFVDTLKAKIQVQERQIKLQEITMELENSKAELNTYLWKDGFIPLELASNSVPELLPDSLAPAQMPRDAFFDSVVLNHPDYLIGTNKIDQAKIKYRLMRESLRPDLELKYNALANNNLDNGLQYDISNYAWGATFSYPIFVRKARGKTKLAQIKIQDAEYDMVNKQAQVGMKIRQTHTTWSMVNNQVSAQETANNNYQSLLDAENTLFNNGESSLFLVNQRDLNLLDAQLKLADLKYKNAVAKIKYEFATQSW